MLQGQGEYDNQAFFAPHWNWPPEIANSLDWMKQDYFIILLSNGPWSFFSFPHFIFPQPPCLPTYFLPSTCVGLLSCSYAQLSRTISNNTYHL